ncbi:MAG: cytochrome c peroxidase [Bacteroidota bacterium]
MTLPLVLLLLLPGTTAPDPLTDWRHFAIERVARTRAALHQWQRQPTPAHFSVLRGAWEEMSWLLRLAGKTETLARLDAHRAWVESSAAQQFTYPQAGTLQLIEQGAQPQVTGRDQAGSVTELHRALEALQRELPAVNVRSEDIRFLLATELYRQYTLVLPGRQRIDRSQAAADFRAFCASLPAWLERSSQALSPEVQSRLTALAGFLHQQPAQIPARLVLYTDYLQPLYRALAQGENFSALARRYGVGGHPDGRLFQESWLDPLRPPEDQARVKLGRLLFFDPLLSGNGKRSCASCHQPSKAFCDGRVTSQGFDFREKLTRNAPTLVNTLHPGTAVGHGLEHPSGEAFLVTVFDHPQEFRTSLGEVTTRLGEYPTYHDYFSRAFPGRGLDSTTVLQALTAYVASLRETDADFDRGLTSGAIQRGYDLFHAKAGCATCHYPPYFSGLRPPEYREREAHSLGLTHHQFGRTGPDPDRGFGTTTGQTRYDYFFRTPTLRNLAYSAPYGHNGAFIGLEETVNYLLHPQKDYPTTLPMSADTLSFAEQSDLLAFLHALNGRIQQRENEDITLPDIHEQHGRQRRRAAGLY